MDQEDSVLNLLESVVETKNVRPRDGGAVNYETRVVAGDGCCGPRGDEGR